MDEGRMNSARRGMISQIRHETGCSGKEAYEATKDPSFMREWVRVALRDDRSDGKPKVMRAPSYRARLKLLKQQTAIMDNNAKNRGRASRIRANLIRTLMEEGLSMIQAIRIARKRSDR